MSVRPSPGSAQTNTQWCSRKETPSTSSRPPAPLLRPSSSRHSSPTMDPPSPPSSRQRLTREVYSLTHSPPHMLPFSYLKPFYNLTLIFRTLSCTNSHIRTLSFINPFLHQASLRRRGIARYSSPLRMSTAPGCDIQSTLHPLNTPSQHIL